MKRLFTFVLFLTFSTTSFLQAQHHNNSPQAFLGVYSNPVSNKKAAALKLDEPNGVLVTSVIDNTPAAENGLRPFDYIYQIGDYKLKPHQSLTYVMRNFQPDDEATVYFIRDTKMLSQNVSFGRKSDAVYTERTAEEDPFLGIEQNHDEVPDDVVGVPVNIVNNSSAEKMGLQDGDIVTAINGYPIYDWHDSGAAIDMMEVGDEMEVTYYRNNQYKTAAASIQSYAATKNNSTAEEQEAKPVVVNLAPMPDMDVSMEDMPEEDAREMKEELGIDMPVVQNLQIEELNIFPNPSQGLFNLKFNLPNNEFTIIRIFDGSGKLIYTRDLGNFDGDFNAQLDLTNNPAGTYYLMVQQGELSISKKVLIVRS